MNILVNPEELIQKGTQLISLSRAFGEEDSLLYETLKNLGDDWVGDDYNSANAEGKKYKPGIDGIRDFMSEFGQILVDAGNEYRARIKQNASRFEG